jgi:hypothetical protein
MMTNARSVILAAFLLSVPACCADSLTAFGHRWQVAIAGDWSVTADEGIETLNLLVPRPSTQPRRPSQYALAETPDFTAVTLDVEVQREPESERQMHPSLILVYAWQDANHFNYAHLSVDAAADVPVHNGIFHVAGGDRVRISGTGGPASLGGKGWQKVRLVYDGRSGKVEVFVDGKTSPSLQAVEPTLGAGKVGIGSFFDKGRFRAVRISGVPAGPMTGN